MGRRKRFLRWACVSCIGLAIANPVGGDEPIGIDDLSWMSGHWVGSEGGVEMEEIWTAPKGGMMLGLHRDVSAGGSVLFEYLRIEDRDGRLVYVASPRGVGTTDFEMVSVSDQRVVFENPAHDFPQRIMYQRDGDCITARIEGMVDGQLESAEWSWFPAR